MSRPSWQEERRIEAEQALARSLESDTGAQRGDGDWLAHLITDLVRAVIAEKESKE